MADVPGWEEIALGEIAAEVTVGYVGPMTSEYVTTGIPFLRSLNVEPFRLDLNDLVHVDEEFHRRLKKSALSPGVVVIVRTGRPGAAAVIPRTMPVANCADLVIVRPGPSIDSRFLAYYINSAARHHVSAHLVGCVQQHFNIGSAKAMRMLLPPLGEQREIAIILGALDDKIDLNRRMNRTLEAMAQAIFSSWFLEFEPVVAKTDRRKPYGMDDETAALFPDMFQESEAGPIPTGWDYSTVGDEFHLVMGQSPPGETYNDRGEGLPFYQGRTDFGHRYPTRRIFCNAPKRSADAGDTLVCVRAPVGDINMASERCCIGRGLAAIRHKSGSRSYTYYRMKSLYEDLAVFEGDGTLFGSIGGAEFRGVRVVEPDKRIVFEFEKNMFPNDQRIESNEEEILALASFRDALLPKLLSGEIRLADAERAVGKVV